MIKLKNQIHLGSLFWSVLRVIFGSIFVVAGVLKFLDLDAFADALGKFKLLTVSTLPYIKISIPIMEILLGLVLIINYKPQLITQIFSIMIIFFTTLLISKMIEGEKISCNCFGPLSNGTINYLTILRNLVLLFFSLALYAYYTNQNKINTTQNKIIPSPFNLILKNYEFYQILKSAFIFTIFFFLSIQTIILALQNRGLKENISLILMNNDVVKPGQRMNSFFVRNAYYSKKLINYKEKPYTILFIFSPNCQPCNINMSIWNDITNNIDKTKFNVIGVTTHSLSELEAYLSKQKANFEVFSSEDSVFVTSYNPYKTPQTIILDSNGVIKKALPGIINEFFFKQASQELGVNIINK